MVPVAGVEPARYRYRRILSYFFHSDSAGIGTLSTVFCHRSKTLVLCGFLTKKSEKTAIRTPFRIADFFIEISSIGGQATENPLPMEVVWRSLGCFT